MRYESCLWLATVLLWTGLWFDLTAQATIAVRRIASAQARGEVGQSLPTLMLWTGHSLSLSFIATGETIQKVWLDDPSRVGMDFDASTCQNNRQQSCTRHDTDGAMVIHLRRIAPITFPHLLTDAGSTTLKVITRTPDRQRRLYQFRLVLSDGEPEYVTVELQPDVPSISPLPMPHPQPLLSAIERGLQVTEQQRRIDRHQPLWMRLQHFLALARQGWSVEQAAQKAGVSLPLIHHLATLGANRYATPAQP